MNLKSEFELVRPKNEYRHSNENWNIYFFKKVSFCNGLPLRALYCSSLSANTTKKWTELNPLFLNYNTLDFFCAIIIKHHKETINKRVQKVTTMKIKESFREV